ncbi:unnamed protein product [Pylaiella littoralis]
MAQSAAGNFIRVAALAVPVTVAFHDVIGSPVEVVGRSMQPAINAHLGTAGKRGDDAPASSWDVDVVWQDKLSISRHKFERGSIVVFRNPFDPKERVVKRLIGVDGDWVRPRGDKYKVLCVPTGCCWVEGDNDRISGDSNHFGPVRLVVVLTVSLTVSLIVSLIADGLADSLAVSRSGVIAAGRVTISDR